MTTNNYNGGIYPIDDDDEDAGLEARIERANGGHIAIPYSNVEFVACRSSSGAFDAVNALLETADLPIRVAHIEDGSNTHIIFLEEQTEKPLVSAVDLLREALQFVPSKAWDEPTLLHKRISKFLETGPQYADCIEKLKEHQ